MSIAWIASVVGAAVAGMFVLLVRPDAFTARDLVWTLGATGFVTFARPLLYLGMERGPMAVFAPVVGVVSLVVPAVIGPLTGDGLRALEVVGVVLAVPAVVLIVSGGALTSAGRLRSNEALTLGVITGVLIGGAGLCFAQVDADAGAMPAFVSQLGTALLIPIVVRPIRPMSPLSDVVRKFGLLVGVIDIGAIIASVIAFQRGNVAVVAAIMGFAPVVTIALAWRVYRERVQRWQWLGAGLAATSVMLFAVAG